MNIELMNIELVYLVYFDNGEMDEWNRHSIAAVCLTKERAEEFAKSYNEQQGLKEPRPDNLSHDGWFYVEEEQVTQ
jgi:hypothetical protein